MKEILDVVLEIGTWMAVILGGLAINLLGMASRRSKVLMLLSFFVLIGIPAAAVRSFAITESSPFTLALDVSDAHVVQRWYLSKAPMDLVLRHLRREGSVEVFSDADGREYEATLPAAPLPSGVTSLALTPRQALSLAWSWRRGFGYYIAPLHEHWLVLTGKSLGLVLASLFLPLTVWLFGLGGTVATIGPDD